MLHKEKSESLSYKSLKKIRPGMIDTRVGAGCHNILTLTTITVLTGQRRSQFLEMARLGLGCYPTLFLSSNTISLH